MSFQICRIFAPQQVALLQSQPLEQAPCADATVPAAEIFSGVLCEECDRSYHAVHAQRNATWNIRQRYETLVTMQIHRCIYTLLYSSVQQMCISPQGLAAVLLACHSQVRSSRCPAVSQLRMPCLIASGRADVSSLLRPLSAADPQLEAEACRSTALGAHCGAAASDAPQDGELAAAAVATEQAAAACRCRSVPHIRCALGWRSARHGPAAP